MAKERGKSQLPTIDRDSFYRILNEDSWIASGVDSQIFLHEGWVIKEYHQNGPPIEQVQLYQEVTELVTQHIDGRTAKIGLDGEITLKVEQIAKVFVPDGHKRVLAVSRYVGGKKLQDGQNKHLDRFLEDISSEVMELTGFTGIELCAPNTKLNKTNRGVGPFAKSVCSITDICRYVKRLHK